MKSRKRCSRHEPNEELDFRLHHSQLPNATAVAQDHAPNALLNLHTHTHIAGWFQWKLINFQVNASHQRLVLDGECRREVEEDVIAVGLRTSRVRHGELECVERFQQRALALRLEVLERRVSRDEVEVTDDAAHEEAEVGHFLVT